MTGLVILACLALYFTFGVMAVGIMVKYPREPWPEGELTWGEACAITATGLIGFVITVSDHITIFSQPVVKARLRSSAKYNLDHFRAEYEPKPIATLKDTDPSIMASYSLCLVCKHQMRQHWYYLTREWREDGCDYTGGVQDMPCGCKERRAGPPSAPPPPTASSVQFRVGRMR